MAKTQNKSVHPTMGRAGLSRVETTDTVVGENMRWIKQTKLTHRQVGKFIMTTFTRFETVISEPNKERTK